MVGRRARELVRVDIKRRAMLRWSPANGATATVRLTDEVSLAVGGQVACQVDRVALVHPDGRMHALAAVEPEETPHTRLNNETCDPARRL